MIPTFFSKQSDFRKWLNKNYKKETELLVGFYKANSGKPSMTWSQSVDEALCFGWIDGIRKSIDKDSYCIRFTPRRHASIWSSINIDKFDKLAKQGLIKPAGLESFKLRKVRKSKIYSQEKELATLTDEYQNKFKANEKAWDFFTTQAPSYQKFIIHWIMIAKQKATQLTRLDKTIRESEKNKRLLWV